MNERIRCLNDYLENLKYSQDGAEIENSKSVSSFCERLIANHQIMCPRKEEVARQSFSPFDQQYRYNYDLPIKLQFLETSGRFLEATRDILAGEILYKETPLVMTPKGGSGPVCLSCFLSLSTVNWPVCDKCSAPKCLSCCGLYHSQQECDILAKIFLTSGKQKDIQFIKLINIVLTPLRTWITTHQDSQHAEVVDALQSNASERMATPIGKFIDQYIVKFIATETELEIDRDYIHKVCGVFDTNAFEIIQESRQSRALLPVSSLMNHSCIPNTQHWFLENKCIVRASVFIKKGEPVTNSYTQSFCGTATRSKHLLLTKLFNCNCPRCNDQSELGTHLSSIICPKCGDKGLLLPPKCPTNRWKCSECYYETAPSVIQNILKVTSGIVSKATSMDTSSILNAISIVTQLLGRQHYTSVELQLCFVRSLSKFHSKASVEDLVEALRTIIFLKSVVSKIEPGLTRMRGILLSDQIKLLLELLTRNQSPGDASSQAVLSSILENIESDFRECEVILKFDSSLEEIQLAIIELRVLILRRFAPNR